VSDTEQPQIPEELMERARELTRRLVKSLDTRLIDSLAEPPEVSLIAAALQAERKRAYLECAEIADPTGKPSNCRTCALNIRDGWQA
jgi:hypothetical protein